MQEGDYTYQLTVTDTIGQQATAQVTVIVQPGEFSLVVHALLLAGLLNRRGEEGFGSDLYDSGVGGSRPQGPWHLWLSTLSAFLRARERERT